MCQGEGTMTRHKLIFLKENVGFALSGKLKMLGGEHLNDTVIYPVHFVDYHYGSTMIAVLQALLSRLAHQEVICLQSADAVVLVLTLQLRLMPEFGVVTQTLSNSDANLWCYDTYPG